MPKYASKHWSLSYDICIKHHLPLPCTECIKTRDKDLEIITDADINKQQNSFDASGKDMG